ncbi:MAG TPA: phytanoyl-CoA dioxygenase family protein [Usitatibacter sp.]|jgi:chlorinating enzyme|nr:phytanoyl-CoA dioxygenase family protein [Usitatibacter sp.]
MKTLTRSQVDAYRRDGYHFPVRVFSAADAAALRASLQSHEAASGGPLQGKWRVKSHLLFTWADRIVHHPAILDAVEDVLGPDILCWTTNFFIKEAASPGFVSWHQDAAYWGLDPEEVVTAWVALTPSNLQSGCMKVVAGSHLDSHIPHVDTFAENNMLTRGQEIAVEVDESKAVSMMLEPGEMSLHHIRLVHGSAPNHSSDRRIGLAIRYMPTRVRQTKGRDSAMLVRGVDAFGHFDAEPRPSRDLGEAELRAHAGAIDRKLAVLYQGTPRNELPA